MGNMSSTNEHTERRTGIAIKFGPSSLATLTWKKLRDLRRLQWFQWPLAACPDVQLMRRCQCQTLRRTAAPFKGVKVLLKLQQLIAPTRPSEEVKPVVSSASSSSPFLTFIPGKKKVETGTNKAVLQC